MKIFKLLPAASIPLCIVACSATAPDPASQQDAAPLVSSILDPGSAFTFARVRTGESRTTTLLVTRLDGDKVRAIDTTELGARAGADAFEVIRSVGHATLRKALSVRTAGRDYPVRQLLSPAGEGTRHVATGTNFREHAQEVKVGEVFNFPKFGRATASRSALEVGPEALLDYEVEICARFDRDIRSVADFEAARKGFFLCGDFTDRARLMRLIDPQDVGSGQGFSDAKSAPGFFPTGPFLVIPDDWRSFVKAERMTTEVNGKRRQDARGGEMILDFEALVTKALTQGGGGRYTYRGSPVPLITRGMIARGAAIMSGTSEGVVFRPPHVRDLVRGGAAYIFTGPMFHGESAQRVMIDRFIAKERSGGRYLKAGDVVAHRSSSMGDLRVQIVPLPRTARAQPPTI